MYVCIYIYIFEMEWIPMVQNSNMYSISQQCLERQWWLARRVINNKAIRFGKDPQIHVYVYIYMYFFYIYIYIYNLYHIYPSFLSFVHIILHHFFPPVSHMATEISGSSGSWLTPVGGRLRLGMALFGGLITGGDWREYDDFVGKNGDFTENRDLIEAYDDETSAMGHLARA